MTASLLVASEQPILCRWLTSLVRQAAYNAVCCTTSSDAFAQVVEHRPLLTVIDVTLADRQGFEVARQLMLAYPPCRCIAIVPLCPDFIEQAFLTDVSGYLPENPDEDEVLACLEAVCQRRRYISPVLTAYLKLPVLAGNRSGAFMELLSERERAVLQLVYEGLNTPRIAEQLGVAISTINTHKQNMVEKLSLKNRRELMIVAAELFGSSS